MLNLFNFRHLAISVFLVFMLPPSLYADGNGVSSRDLIGNWQWLGAVTPLKEIAPLPNQEYTLSFIDEGRFSMKLETNVVNGSYEAEENRLKIKQPLAMTMAAWLPNSPAPEVISLLEHSSSFFFSGGLLYIDTVADGGTLRFKQME